MSQTETYEVTSPARRAEVEAKIWQLAQRQVSFGYGEVVAELSLSERLVREVLLGWVAEGRLTERGPGKRHRKMFEVTAAYRAPKDRAGMIAQQLWTAMRGLKTFDPIDLAAQCREDLSVSVAEASAYAQSMLRGGYLKVRRTASPGLREATYQLVRDTGPRPPRERRVTAVWDPNEANYAYVAGVGRITANARSGGAK